MLVHIGSQVQQAYSLSASPLKLVLSWLSLPRSQDDADFIVADAGGCPDPALWTTLSGSQQKLLERRSLVRFNSISSESSTELAYRRHSFVRSFTHSLFNKHLFSTCNASAAILGFKEIRIKMIHSLNSRMTIYWSFLRFWGHESQWEIGERFKSSSQKPHQYFGTQSSVDESNGPVLHLFSVPCPWPCSLAGPSRQREVELAPPLGFELLHVPCYDQWDLSGNDTEETWNELALWSSVSCTSTTSMRRTPLSQTSSPEERWETRGTEPSCPSQGWPRSVSRQVSPEI